MRSIFGRPAHFAHAVAFGACALVSATHAAEPSFGSVASRQVIEEVVHPYSVRTYATPIQVAAVGSENPAGGRR